LRQKIQGKLIPVHAKNTHTRGGVTAPLMQYVKNDTRDMIVVVVMVITMTIKRHQERTLQTIYFVHNMSGRAASLYVGCPGHLITIRRLLSNLIALDLLNARNVIQGFVITAVLTLGKLSFCVGEYKFLCHFSET
jgi:hypothetical protein